MCITKGTTLKGIRVSDVKINNCIFADQRSDTFCTAHVCGADDGWRNHPKHVEWFTDKQTVYSCILLDIY